MCCLILFTSLQTSSIKVLEFTYDDISGMQSYFSLMFPQERANRFERRAELNRWLDLKIQKDWSVRKVLDGFEDQLITLGLDPSSKRLGEKIFGQYFDTSRVNDPDYLESRFVQPVPPCKFNNRSFYVKASSHWLVARLFFPILP